MATSSDAPRRTVIVNKIVHTTTKEDLLAMDGIVKVSIFHTERHQTSTKDAAIVFKDADARADAAKQFADNAHVQNGSEVRPYDAGKDWERHGQHLGFPAPRSGCSIQ
jgi:hypothetical protein